MTPSLLASAAVVGQLPIAPMWMCCTCGYGLPLNEAARPSTCSVMVACEPFNEIIRVPLPLEWFKAASWAW